VWKMITVFVEFCCIGFIDTIGVVDGVWRQKLALSIRPKSGDYT
jgi:hypothetical protein